MKTAVGALDVDVSRQASQPALTKTRPQQRANHNDYQPDDDQIFTQLIHGHVKLGRGFQLLEIFLDFGYGVNPHALCVRKD